MNLISRTKILGIVIIGIAAHIAADNFHTRFFELSWQEEIQVSDAEVVIVQRKTTYERLTLSFEKFGGKVITRDGELTLDAGGDLGQIKQLFKGMHPIFLGRANGVWYAVLSGTYYAGSRQIPGQDWGELEGPYGQWAIKLIGGQWEPISMTRLPTEFQHPNVLILYGTVAEHSQFAGRTITLAEKFAWNEKHPPDYADVRLTRARRPSNRTDWVEQSKPLISK